MCVQELQLHLGVLQQHAALIGGPNATSCPICHKLFLGADALMEHMKHTHKDPNANAGAASKYLILILCAVVNRKIRIDFWIPMMTTTSKKNQTTKWWRERKNLYENRAVVFIVAFFSCFLLLHLQLIQQNVAPPIIRVLYAVNTMSMKALYVSI